MKNSVDLNVKFLFLIMLLILFAVGCMRKQIPSQPRARQWIRWATAKDCPNPDPITATESACFAQMNLTLEGLTRTDFQEGKVRTQLALANSITFINESTVHIALKENIRWSNGQKLEAKHFVRAWQKLLSPSSPAKIASLLFPIAKAKEYYEKKVPFSSVGIRVTDPTSIVLTLGDPAPHLPVVLSHPATFPVFCEHRLCPPAFLGPFVLTKKEVEERALFEPNPFYFEGLRELAGIAISFVPQQIKRMRLFQDGAFDIADDVPEGVTRDKSLSGALAFSSTNSVFVLYLNPTKKPFQTADYRKVFISSVDRTELLRLYPTPHSLANHLILPATSSPKSWFPNFDQERSQKEFKSFETDFSGTHAPPLLAWSGDELTKSIAENIQAQWIRTLGFKFDLVDTEHKKDPTPLECHTAACILELRLNPFSKGRGTEQFSAFMAVTGLNVRLTRTTTEETNSETAAENFEQTLIQKEAVILPLFARRESALVRPAIHGLFQSATGAWEFRNVTVQ